MKNQELIELLALPINSPLVQDFLNKKNLSMPKRMFISTGSMKSSYTIQNNEEKYSLVFSIEPYNPEYQLIPTDKKYQFVPRLAYIEFNDNTSETIFEYGIKFSDTFDEIKSKIGEPQYDVLDICCNGERFYKWNVKLPNSSFRLIVFYDTQDACISFIRYTQVGFTPILWFGKNFFFKYFKCTRNVGPTKKNEMLSDLFLIQWGFERSLLREDIFDKHNLEKYKNKQCSFLDLLNSLNRDYIAKQDFVKPFEDPLFIDQFFIIRYFDIRFEYRQDLASLFLIDENLKKLYLGEEAQSVLDTLEYNQQNYSKVKSLLDEKLLEYKEFLKNNNFIENYSNCKTKTDQIKVTKLIISKLRFESIDRSTRRLELSNPKQTNQFLVELSEPPKGYVQISEYDGIRSATLHPSNYGVELTEQDCIDLINQYHPTAIEIQNRLNREFVFDFEQLTKPSLIENLVLYLDSDVKVENLEKLENLQGLHLSTNGFLSVDYTKLRNLKRLSMTYDPKNTTWMNSKTIENLELYKCGRHRDFNFLSAMESLQIVNAFNLPVYTLKGLEKLPKLKALSIDGFKKLENYEEIGDLTELEYLRILNPPANINFDFLVNLKKLKWLWLDPFKITFKRDNELPNLIQYPASDDQNIKDIRGDKRLRPFDRHWWRNGHEFFPDYA